MKWIPVLPEHIKAGVRATSNACPIALALKDAGYAWATVGVTMMTVRPYGGDSMVDVAMSTGLSEWVRKFDDEQGRSIPPMLFGVDEELGAAIGPYHAIPLLMGSK